MQRDTWLSLRWPLVVLLVVAAGYLALDRTLATLERAPRLALAGLAERFASGRITTTFTAALPRLQPGGAVLELASFEAVETLSRSDQRSVFFELVPLGTNVTEIRVPVTYRYHLRLGDPWQLDVKGQVCQVRAPRIRPSLPPAIHTDRLERRAERGWLRFDLQQQMDELERSLTPTLSTRAMAPETLALVREPCRQRVAGFVRDWLLREDQWRDDRFTAVSVAFDDEPAGAVHAPTLEQPGKR
jgi:hypothetical protein